MALINPGGEGRHVYGYTQTQAEELIAQGRLNSNDLIVLSEEGSLFTHNTLIGGGNSDDVNLELDTIIGTTRTLISKTV